jgi:hypothetical protein
MSLLNGRRGNGVPLEQLPVEVPDPARQRRMEIVAQARAIEQEREDYVAQLEEQALSWRNRATVAEEMYARILAEREQLVVQLDQAKEAGLARQERATETLAAVRSHLGTASQQLLEAYRAINAVHGPVDLPALAEQIMPTVVSKRPATE